MVLALPVVPTFSNVINKTKSIGKILSLTMMFYFQAAGVDKPLSGVNPSIAEEALEELNNRIYSLEMEQEDLKFKVCMYI